MVRVILVRLKDKTTDEYPDADPYLERAGRVHGIIRHQYELNEDGSLAVFRETYSAIYSRSQQGYYNWEEPEVSRVGHYLPGHYTSVREIERDLLEGQRPEPD